MCLFSYLGVSLSDSNRTSVNLSPVERGDPHFTLKGRQVCFDPTFGIGYRHE